ncbi:MAG: hypothetical protein IJJ26_07620 [Victivallales bacterium]|nr:hypothetical protein [Victivallales bacterium]
MDSSSQESLRQELLTRLKALENLNPDLSVKERERLASLASQVGADFFPEVAQECARLAVAYMNCDVKRAGANIMREYFHALEDNARLLREAGELQELPEEQPGTFTTALVPRRQTTALDFCKLLNRSAVPKPLVKAADAFRRRNVIVSTVFEHALRTLWGIDGPRAMAWVVRFFEQHSGNLDPDIVRDALAVCLSFRTPLSPELLSWVERFCADPNLLEYWPTVVRLADKVLCRAAICAWFTSHKPRSTQLSHLKIMAESQKWEDEKLLDWTKRSLALLGCSVQRFMSLEKEDLPRDWRTATLLAELHRISELYVPTMMAVDHILALPSGTEQLAMAFMGLAGEALDEWERAINQFSVKVVNRMFLLDMHAKRPVVDTIKRLTFGDTCAFKLACEELDLATQTFESLSQREKVSRYLGIFYASSRRSQLLGVEVAHRYRNLMRLVHDDFLAQLLSPQQLQELHRTDILPEIATLAAEARKYLGKRRTQENTLEQMMAAKIAFERFVREKRLSLARTLLKT